MRECRCGSHWVSSTSSFCLEPLLLRFRRARVPTLRYCRLRGLRHIARTPGWSPSQRHPRCHQKAVLKFISMFSSLEDQVTSSLRLSAFGVFGCVCLILTISAGVQHPERISTAQVAAEPNFILRPYSMFLPMVTCGTNTVSFPTFFLSLGIFRGRISTNFCRPTFYIKLSKAPSRITSSRGSGNISRTSMAKPGPKKIMADIDRRIAAVPPFPGLRRFPEGRGFKQWTGDDSKALMKVYLPAIEGHVPTQMVRALSAFLDFCYLVRRNAMDEVTLDAIDMALARFHHERAIFVESGVCPDGFCLPRQHSLTHYRHLITQFGAPNGLCSSITESKHIKAVKKPWRRSSRFEALAQMLTINDRLDKLAAARVDFTVRGMMSGPTAGPLPPPAVPLEAEEDDDGGPSDERRILGDVKLAKTPVRRYPRDPAALAAFLKLPDLVPLIQRFLYLQDHPDHDLDNFPLSQVPLDNCPDAPRSVKAFPSAVAKFYAPSDQSGMRGMLHERIRAVRSWRGGPARYDCVFVEGNPDLPGFRGLLAARVLLFMSFKYSGVTYPCALVTWFSAIGDEPCPDIGMWMVEADTDRRGRRVMDIIHVDTILRGAHLIGIYGNSSLPRHIKYSDTLDSFSKFYVNKYADHHANEIAF
ncbi:hypothetical protein MSAN_02070600 [Mycena sanguinolenta]|uniref:Uncharacterized protein n=1 Tax=Mycena sanguinolenta TaxID=230812 RepID=A0A8H6XJN8_9AGAR|nr:hypothetical protein MSAN_02070600 [Mycena sanguinolenta]